MNKENCNCRTNQEEIIEEEMVDHPKHYIQSGIECIDEMVLLFGIKATADFCKLNVFKYRSRAIYKGNPERDMEKSNWYMNKYVELSALMDMENEYENEMRKRN